MPAEEVRYLVVAVAHLSARRKVHVTTYTISNQTHHTRFITHPTKQTGRDRRRTGVLKEGLVDGLNCVGFAGRCGVLVAIFYHGHVLLVETWTRKSQRAGGGARKKGDRFNADVCIAISTAKANEIIAIFLDCVGNYGQK